MAIATVLSRTQRGINAPLVRVEVDIGNGLPTFTLVGLPAAVVKESKDRVRAALINSNFEFPPGRLTINLAPAELPKEGGRFDLPIAVGILIATGQLADVEGSLADCELYGELSLSGELRFIKGALPAALAASRAQHSVIVPHVNAAEAALAKSCRVMAAGHLLEVCRHLGAAAHKGTDLPADTDPVTVTGTGIGAGASIGTGAGARIATATGTGTDIGIGIGTGGGAGRLPFYKRVSTKQPKAALPDLREVQGQPHARRALEIAASGEHSLLLIGPPGSGKSMLAHRLPGILPPMNDSQALEVATLRSIIGQGLKPSEWRVRPFRAPHHTASGVALVGGGAHPRPGEISLAHNGVLFLDELPEFERGVLEVLREPMESGLITISRAARQAEFPARFQLIAAMNPCPCGYLGDSSGHCHCTPDQMLRYRGRISGPLLDRLDLHVSVPRVEFSSLRQPSAVNECSAEVAARVMRTREVQAERQGTCNARLDTAAVERYCTPDAAGLAILERAMRQFDLSARSYHRVLKVARTLADMSGRAHVEVAQVSEALTLRPLDRRGK